MSQFTIEIYKKRTGWTYRVRHENTEIVMPSEGHKNFADLTDHLKNLKENFASAEVSLNIDGKVIPFNLEK